MKKYYSFFIILVFVALAMSTKGIAKEGEARTPFHFNIGYSANKFIVPTLDETTDVIQTPFAHGAHVSFDWQGNGRLGLQIPVSYYFHKTNNGYLQEIDLGANLMVHFTKRDKVFDPYLAVGLKWIGGEIEEGNWAPLAIPLVSTNLGLRHFFTPHIGIFAEAGASNLLFVVWQLEGRAGLSVGF